MRGSWAWLVAMVVALAGCSDGGNGADGRDSPNISSQPDPGTEKEIAVPPRPTGPPIDVDWDGRTSIEFCVPEGSNACQGASVTEPDDRLEFSGTNYRNLTVSLILTWDADGDPFMEELTFRGAAFSSCGNGCYSGEGGRIEATGTSPLELVGETVGEAGATSWHLVVEVPKNLPSDLYGFVSREIPFHVEGTLAPR